MYDLKAQLKKQHIIMLFFLSFFTVNPANAMFVSNQMQKDWYNLNHYDDRGVSDIQNANYFIAPDGRENPLGEYDAFVHMIRQYQQTGNHKDRLCDFPARLTFAEKYTDDFTATDRPECLEFQRKIRPNDLQSVSLIFANGYFNNPSSYYGHTLLRLNYDRATLRQHHLDASVNYGADVTHNEGSVLNIVYGLFGGYGASYQLNNDFIHSHRYTNGQLRDLWNYELSLTTDQKRFVAEHYWELRKAKFNYYFVNDNCAHRVINLVERATGENLTQTHGIWLLPLQVVHHLQSTRNDGNDKSFIAATTYAPSAKTKFEARYSDLSESDQHAFLHFLRSDLDAQRQQVDVLPNDVLILLGSIGHYGRAIID